MVATYQLFLADTHLPGRKLAKAMKLAGIDGMRPAISGTNADFDCANAAAAIATLLEHLPKIE